MQKQAEHLIERNIDKIESMRVNLYGEIEISGAKNAVLPIMTASIIEPGKYVLNNVPNLRDTRTMSG